MATNTASTFTLDNFRMPSEPHPLPSLGSDEESFVILGKSMSPDEDAPSSEELFQPPSVTVVEEAKKLINKEISLLEQMSLDKKMMGVSLKDVEQSSSGNIVQSQDKCEVSVKEQSNSDAAVTSYRSDDSLGTPKMQQSAIFNLTNSVINGLPEIQNLPKWSFEDLPSEEVQRKISQIIDENVHLKDALLQNNMSMKSQYERIVAWQEDVQKVHQAHRQKLAEAKDFIEKMKADNLMVKHQLEKSNELSETQKNEIADLKLKIEESKRLTNAKIAQSSDNNIKEFELDAANKKIKELENILKTSMVENKILNEEKSKLELDASAGKCEIEKLVNDNILLKNENSKLTDTIEKNNIDRELIQQKCVQLELELEKAKNTAVEREEYHARVYNDLQYRASSPPELQHLRAQLASTQGMLTQVEQSRAAAYSQVAMMTDQIRGLTDHVESLQAQTHHKDEIYALLTQLEVYKADFEVEKQAKETIKEEKDKLAEDLQNLQRRNQQLQEELEVARDNVDYVVYPHGNRPRDSPNQNLKCPKCSFGFTSVRALENHVYRRYLKYPDYHVKYKQPIVLPLSLERSLKTPLLPDRALTGVYNPSSDIAYKR
ncbi:unnamed protein product [Phaedon cochleariae]|nr:unnamed protein product [Phaedon cochleariae]